MQRNAHHQRLALFEHLVVAIDDHVGEFLGSDLAPDDLRDIVDLLRIGNREQRARSRVHARGLIIVAPVEVVLVTRLLQQIRRTAALGNPRREPAARRRAFFLFDTRRATGDERTLFRLRHVPLALGVGVAVSDDLAAPRVVRGAKRADHLGAVVVQTGVDQHAHRQFELVEQVQAAPDADPVAIIAPGVVQHVGLTRGRKLRAHARAELEMLDVEADVEREALPVRPDVVGSPGDRRVVIAIVRPKCAHARW